MELFLCKSKAGHDKGKLFAVIGKEGDHFLLADGKGRTVAKPKRKKSMHLQPIYKFPKDPELMTSPTDSSIRKLIKQYEKAVMDKES